MRTRLFFPFLTSLHSFLAYSFICKKFAIFTGQDLYTQTFISTLFVISIGVGSFFWDKIENKQLVFYKAQTFLAFFFILLPFLLESSLLLIEIFPFQSWPLISGVLISLLGLASSSELPFYIKDFKDSSLEKILFLNYLGTLFACILFINLTSSETYYLGLFGFTGILNFFIAKQFAPNKSQLNYFHLCLIFIILGNYQQFGLYQQRVKKAAYLDLQIESIADLKNLWIASDIGENIYSISSPYQEIDFVSENLFHPLKKSKEWGLYLNKKIQIYSDSEKIYHQTMALTPLLFLDKSPLNVLVLGGGDLGLIRELSRIPWVENLTLVELDETVINLAKNGPFLNEIHDGDYEYKLIIQDGFSYLANTEVKYDLILADFPFPNSYDLMKLYSVEFYKLVRKRLTTKGVFVFDYPFKKFPSPRHQQSQNNILKTLNNAKFNFQIWGLTDTFVISGKNPLPLRTKLSSLDFVLANQAITNIIEITDDIEVDLSSSQINSVFKPLKEFYIDP